MAEELKVRSIRLDDATYQKLREIAEGIQGNQQEAIQTLINAYFLQQEKANLPDHKANIDEFERYVTSLLSMYTTALQAQQNTRQSVLKEFDIMLKSKDNIIQDLQEKLKIVKQLCDDIQNKDKGLIEENKQLKDTISNLQISLSDKDNLNKALTDSCNNLRMKIESLEVDVAQVNTLRNELIQTKEKYQQLQQENIACNAVLEQQKQQSQLTLDKSLLEANKINQEQLQQIKSDAQAKIDEYQQKYLTLLNEMYTQIKPVKSTRTKKQESERKLSLDAEQL